MLPAGGLHSSYSDPDFFDRKISADGRHFSTSVVFRAPDDDEEITLVDTRKVIGLAGTIEATKKVRSCCSHSVVSMHTIWLMSFRHSQLDLLAIVTRLIGVRHHQGSRHGEYEEYLLLASYH